MTTRTPHSPTLLFRGAATLQAAVAEYAEEDFD